MPPPDLTRHLRPPDGPGIDDAELLRRFADHRDEAAFELLVWRHGGMVQATCRRILGRSADADDAFQVTWLALARRAGSIRTAAALPGWLHRVARRAALRVKATCRVRTTAHLPEPAVEPAPPDDLGPVLDEEIDRLPEKLRRAFVLCHLEGVTNEAAAARLGCPKGTILSRLSRARERLRDRLTRRGIVAPALLVLPPATLPSAVVAAATARAAAAFVVGGNSAEVPAHVATLAREILRTMRLTQLRPIGLLFALVLVGGAGLAAVGRPKPADPPPPPREPVAAARLAPAPAPVPPGPRRLAVDKHDCPDVLQAAFSPDGKVVALSGSKPVDAAVEDVLTLWDAATGKNLHTFRGRDAGASGFCFSPDGTRLAQPVTDTGEVIVREVASGAELRRLPHKLVYAVEFSRDGRYLATTSGGEKKKSSQVHVWDVATGKRVFTPVRAKDEAFLWAVFVPDGRLVVVTDAGRVRRWNPATGAEEPAVTLAGEAGRFAVPARDGRTFLGSPPGRRPTLFDGTTGRAVRTFGREGDAFEVANFSEDARAVIAADKGGRVVVWDAATGGERATFTVPDLDGGKDAAFVRSTPTGRHLVVQWTKPIDGGRDTVPWVAVYTPDGRLVRRGRGVSDLEFDDPGRSVVVVTRTPSTPETPPVYDVTVHDAAAWLAGGAGKE